MASCTSHGVYYVHVALRHTDDTILSIIVFSITLEWHARCTDETESTVQTHGGNIIIHSSIFKFA